MREKKKRERERGGEEETLRNANGEREEEKREKEAAIKQIWTGVRLAGRCGHREYCGRKGTAWGEPHFFFLIFTADAPPSPASLSVNHRLF